MSENLDRYTVPEDLRPLTGHIDVYRVIPAAVFNKYWKIHNQHRQILASDEDHPLKNMHSVQQVYMTRRPLVASSRLTIDGEKVALPGDPAKLADMAIAPFVVQATQAAVIRATSLPNLPPPSKPGGGSSLNNEETQAK